MTFMARDSGHHRDRLAKLRICILENLNGNVLKDIRIIRGRREVLRRVRGRDFMS